MGLNWAHKRGGCGSSGVFQVQPLAPVVSPGWWSEHLHTGGKEFWESRECPHLTLLPCRAVPYNETSWNWCCFSHCWCFLLSWFLLSCGVSTSTGPLWELHLQLDPSRFPSPAPQETPRLVGKQLPAGWAIALATAIWFQRSCFGKQFGWH